MKRACACGCWRYNARIAKKRGLDRVLSRCLKPSFRPNLFKGTDEGVCHGTGQDVFDYLVSVARIDTWEADPDLRAGPRSQRLNQEVDELQCGGGLERKRERERERGGVVG